MKGLTEGRQEQKHSEPLQGYVSTEIQLSKLEITMIKTLADAIFNVFVLPE